MVDRAGLFGFAAYCDLMGFCPSNDFPFMVAAKKTHG